MKKRKDSDKFSKRSFVIFLVVIAVIFGVYGYAGPSEAGWQSDTSPQNKSAQEEKEKKHEYFRTFE